VTDTLKIPAGTHMVGEGWSVITGKPDPLPSLPPFFYIKKTTKISRAGKGHKFSDQTKPKVVVQFGEDSSTGKMEVTDFIFSTMGPTPGAIVVEWNVKESTQGAAGIWDRSVGLILLCPSWCLIMKMLFVISAGPAISGMFE